MDFDMAKVKQANGQKRAVLVASEKGGVGKSGWVGSLVSIARQDGDALAAFDSDGSVGGLVRICGTKDEAGNIVPDQDPMVGVGYYSGRDDRDGHRLVTSGEAGYPVMIHDLAGGLLDDMTKIVDGGKGLEDFVATFADNGYRITFVHMLSNTIAAAQSVGRYLDYVGDGADHVAVLNRHFGEYDADFPFWVGFTDPEGIERGGKARKRFLELGGIEIEMPAMPRATYAKLDALNLPATDASTSKGLNSVEKTHARKFVRDFKAAIEPARDLLGFNA